MTARKAALRALVLAVICCGLMALIDGYIRPSYGIKSAVKIVLFLCLPLALFRKQKPLFSRFRAEKRGLLTALGLGFGVYAVILAAYFLIDGMGWYDFSGIVGQLSANAGVHRGNFLYISLYIYPLPTRCWRNISSGAGCLTDLHRLAQVSAGGCAARCLPCIMWL